MNVLLIVDNLKRWTEIQPGEIPGVEIVASRAYLTDPRFAAMSRALVLNLCRSYKYQSTGYYVSLLAMARGHRPLPTVATMQDLKLTSIRRLAAEQLDTLIDSALGPLKSERFELSIYLGKNLTARYDRLAMALFNLFPAPLLRATFKYGEDGWSLEGLRVIGAAEVPDTHREFIINRVASFIKRGQRTARARKSARYDIAILHDPEDAMPPSCERALRMFIKGAAHHELEAELITPEDYGRLAEFDALFIRATTAVNHYTYRFARRAEAEGLFVIDDSESILRCTNKVYLAELLEQNGVAAPRSVVFAGDNAHLVAERIGFPCVVKLPDSAFSAGVMKYESQEAFEAALPKLLERSDLLLAQEFAPTAYDWRVGVLGGEPLYVCKYHMAKAHWQIINHAAKGSASWGSWETMRVEDAPANVVKTAVKAANLIGRGLYGVDLKILGGRAKVIEVNDNPSIDHKGEDLVLGQELYNTIMGHFLKQLEGMRQR